MNKTFKLYQVLTILSCLSGKVFGASEPPGHFFLLSPFWMCSMHGGYGLGAEEGWGCPDRRERRFVTDLVDRRAVILSAR